MRRDSRGRRSESKHAVKQMRMLIALLSASTVLGAPIGAQVQIPAPNAAAPYAKVQIAAPNARGVSMGHINLNATDAEAANRFWIALGGAPSSHGRVKYVVFPGAMVVVRQAEPTAPAAGSVVDHFGFYVANVRQSLARWQDAGISTNGCTARSCRLTTPDGLILVDIVEKRSLAVPVVFGYVYLRVTDPRATQKWYAETFGATPQKEGSLDAAALPGGLLLFAKADAPTAPTVGRAVNHIGFEVANLEKFYRNAEASGVKVAQPWADVPEQQETRASVIDPWGTRIELNDGVAGW